MPKVDYEKEIGKKYGRLTIKSLSFGGKTLAVCKCDCGNVKKILLQNLRKGTTKSCGCLNKEIITERMKLYHQIKGNKTIIDRLNEVCVENTNLDKLSDIPYKNNSSGVRNVCLYKGKFKARVTFKKRSYFLGYYDDMYEAEKEAQKFRDEHFKPIKERYGLEYADR